MSNATRTAITELIANKDAAEARVALDRYIVAILKKLADGEISLEKAHRDVGEAYGYMRHFEDKLSRGQ